MCEFSSITMDQVKAHMMRNHTGGKPYKCNQCSEGIPHLIRLAFGYEI